ncbi:hypothetical protein B7494_g1250 [Chlorociboria aeruginascens]|nr:hypothetical protein B7494_g1250 [Chlorociboria aeruginascens]
MVINPTYLAQRTRQSVNWTDAKRRVVSSYREWIRSAPEIQTMYSLSIPVSALRTKMRQEFERHRYVNQIKTVDVLLFQSHTEYQRNWNGLSGIWVELENLGVYSSSYAYILLQETLNYWKQLPHILKYFRPEEDPSSRLPQNFISGFLEGRN